MVFSLSLSLSPLSRDLGGDAEFIGACHFSLREIMFANSDENRDPFLTNKRPLINLAKAESNKKYKDSGVLTFRGCDIFTLLTDVDAEADKSIARTRQVWEDNKFKIDKRQAYLAHMMHGQAIQKHVSALQASEGGGRRHTRSASGEAAFGGSSRDIFSSVMGPKKSKGGDRRKTNLFDMESLSVIEDVKASPVADDADGNYHHRRKRSKSGRRRRRTLSTAPAPIDDSTGSGQPTESPARSASPSQSPSSNTNSRHRRQTLKSRSEADEDEDDDVDEDEEEDGITSLRPGHRSKPSVSSSLVGGGGDISATMSMRNAADLFAAARSKDAPTAFTFKVVNLAKSSFFSSPDSYLEFYADRRLKGNWEKVATTDVVQSNVNPTYQPLILKQKSFLSQRATMPSSANSAPQENGELLTVQIKAFSPVKKGEPKLIGSVITSYDKLRSVQTRLELVSGANLPVGVVITESVKVVASTVVAEDKKHKKKK